MTKKDAPEPEGFRPIEFTPPVVEDFTPIEVTPHDPQAAPVAPAETPATGKKES